MRDRRAGRLASRRTSIHAAGGDERKVLLLDGFEKGQESRVLAQQILDLRDARACPVLDPGLGQIVFDVVESALVHEADDRPGTRAGQWARWLILGEASAYFS